jgi:uncharacterized protein YdaU (DUF1376 family)
MKGSPDKYMTLWIGDLQKSTTRLSAEQLGAYISLLMDYWVNGPLPAGDDELARVTKLPKRKWRSHRPVLREYFEERDGKWYQSRSDYERAKAQEYAVKRIEKARKAGNSRWEKERIVHAGSIASSMLGACSPPSQPYIESKGAGSEKPRSIRKQVYDYGVDLLARADKSEDEARAVISTWLARYDDQRVLVSIFHALMDEAASPIGWVEDRLREQSASDNATGQPNSSGRAAYGR